MSLNIKNPQAHELAQRLAKKTGESLATAVTVALRERLGRLEEAESGDLAQQLLQIGAECAEHLREPYRTADHGQLLYDDAGLPR
ncbi:MAG: type II toxin-antitoxin system VapB family antitoxin [Chloroflexi bacterium]|nr:type II toxin-antitoxin system VapB family antitoxin [Chloroflexota bacterium]